MVDEAIKDAYRKFLWGALGGCLIFLLRKLKAHIPHTCWDNNPGGEFDSGAGFCTRCIKEYAMRCCSLRRRRIVSMVLMIISSLFGVYTLALLSLQKEVEFFHFRMSGLFFLLAVFLSYDYNLVVPYLDNYFIFCVGSVLLVPVAWVYNVNTDYISGVMILSVFFLMILGHVRAIVIRRL